MASINIIKNGTSTNFNISIPILTTSTAKATAAKTVTGANDNFGVSLVTGTHILLKLTNGNSAASPTLSINSGTAKSIVGSGSSAPVQFSHANAIMHLVYDGTSWVIVG